MNYLKKYCIHPFLIAIFPTLALYTTNRNQVGFEEIIRSLLVSFGIALALFLLLRLLNLNHQKTGLVISIGAIFFFSFGHMLTVLADAQIHKYLIPSPELATIFWLIIWVILTWIANRSSTKTTQITLFLNVVSIVLVGMTCIQLIINSVYASEPVDQAALFEEDLGLLTTAWSNNVKPNTLPDIYYLILDGYGRQDMLKKVMGFDNTSFIQSLQDRGFYIAQESTSNYSNTAPSIASSLNFGYLTNLSDTVGKKTMDYQELRELIRENRIFQMCRQYGYEIITFQTGFSTTEIQSADQYIETGCNLNPFESMLIKGSFAVLWSSNKIANCYKDRIIEPLEHISKIQGTSKPKFVFAHIMAAHPPYVFGPNGESISGSTHVEVDTEVDGLMQIDIQRYSDQITYINSLMIEMIDEIQEKPGTKPVIILQGDHGSGMYMDWQSVKHTCFSERKAILNAYYLPDVKTNQLISFHHTCE